MLLTIVHLVLSLAAILGAAIVFTNTVEILGERLDLGGGAVGSVLAAVLIALTVGVRLRSLVAPAVSLLVVAIAFLVASRVPAWIGLDSGSRQHPHGRSDIP